MNSTLLEKLRGSPLVMHAVLVAITIAVAFAAWGLGYQIQVSRLAAAERSARAQGLLGQAEKIRAEWTSLQVEQAAVTAEVEGLRAKLPEAAEESTFLHQLSELAAEHQIVMSEFRPGSVVRCEDHKEMELRLRCSGEYSNLCRWLAGVEQLPRMSRVSQLIVNAPRLANEACTLDCQLNLLFGLVPKVAAIETVTP
jgi:Tfp pilus assembly protein PilO